MNELSPKFYTGSVVEKGPRSAWIICNPSGIRVFINPSSIPNNTNSIRVRIGFNRFGPVAIAERETEEFNTDSII